MGCGSNEERRSWLLEYIGNLKKLRYLNLSGCMDAMDPSQDKIGSLLDSISTISNLEHLDLSMNFELYSIPENMGNLRKLRTLDVLGCINLEKLPDSMVNMVSLKVINVDRWVTFDAVSLPHFVVHASSHSSNIIRLQPTNPVKLVIDRFENVKSSIEARSIKLEEKQKIRDLSFQWTVDVGRLVDDKDLLEELVPPCSVKRLSITGYMSFSIPDWLMDISHYLTNLKDVCLSDFPKCKNLPPLGPLPNLKKLSLLNMESLEEWSTAYTTTGKECWNWLVTLIINHCAKLRIKPCLPRALSLYIADCDNVLSSWGESSSWGGASPPSGVFDLFVEDSKVPLHQWRFLHQLPHVRNLSILHCSDLTTSPEIIQHLSSIQSLTLDQAELPRWLVKLTSLQTLHLSKCGGMTSPPQWLGELASLRRIEIEDCEGMVSLPDSIQQLTNLEHLIIQGCPMLVEWCESEENKMKLVHVRDKWLWWR